MGPHSITVLQPLLLLPVECLSEDCEDVERERERVGGWEGGGGRMLYACTAPVTFPCPRSLTPIVDTSPSADLYLAV